MTLSLLVGFTREYPDIKVELTTDDSLVDIVQQGFDAGVRLSGIVEKDMISVAIAPGLSPLARGTPTKLRAKVATQRFIPAGAGNTS